MHDDYARIEKRFKEKTVVTEHPCGVCGINVVDITIICHVCMVNGVVVEESTEVEIDELYVDLGGEG